MFSSDQHSFARSNVTAPLALMPSRIGCRDDVFPISQLLYVVGLTHKPTVYDSESTGRDIDHGIDARGARYDIICVVSADLGARFCVPSKRSAVASRPGTPLIGQAAPQVKATTADDVSPKVVLNAGSSSAKRHS